MAKTLQNIDLTKLSQTIRAARGKRGWTLEQLSYELRRRGFPTAQNKLWRLENRPPKRIDTELLLFLEKVLGVELIESGKKKQVLIEDVVELVDQFIDAAGTGSVPDAPDNHGLQSIYDLLASFSRASSR